jgi:hypothetical protein
MEASCVSTSLYYSARRSHQLSSEERSAVDRLVNTFAINDESGGRAEWEGFWVYDPADPSEPDVVFEGATKLPDDSPENMWEALQHWTALVSQIRRTLPDATWDVHVDEHELVWDEQAQEYDPSQ